MGIAFVDHFILKFMMFLSRINMCIENKLNVVTSSVCLLNVLFWSPNENKIVRASVTEIKREIFEILTARCLNCFLSVKSIALVGALAK